MNFDIQTSRLSADSYAIRLSGEIDLFSAPHLKTTVLELVGADARWLIVDLTDATFLDSTTLGVLVGAGKRLREVDGELIVVCGDGYITKILALTRLDRVFTIFPTLELAISSLEPKPA